MPQQPAAPRPLGPRPLGPTPLGAPPQNPPPGYPPTMPNAAPPNGAAPYLPPASAPPTGGAQPGLLPPGMPEPDGYRISDGPARPVLYRPGMTPAPGPGPGFPGAPGSGRVRGPTETRAPTVRTRDNEDEWVDPKQRLEEQAKRFAPPVLISMIVHMVLVIIMGLIHLQVPNNKNQIALVASTTEELGEQELDPTRMEVERNLLDNQMLQSLDIPVVENPFNEAPAITADHLIGNQPIGTGVQVSVSVHLAGRQRGMKNVLRGKYGGKGTEGVVTAGLQWLANNQDKKGSWSLMGPYAHGAVAENREAATAMALLAFQGDGHTHLAKGPFQKNVADGVNWLLKSQRSDGDFFGGGQRDQHLYTHAQCTMAVCELYALSKDSALKIAAERAVNFIVEAQSDLGGWRYTPRSDADVSVTGWMVMALQSAMMAGIEVPLDTLKHTQEFLDKCTSDGSQYSYLANQQSPTRSMTAEALLCRQYLGWAQDDTRLTTGAKMLIDPKNNGLPDWKDRDHYYWYYATQVMHHMEGDYWETWNPIMRDLLVNHQVQQGKERGSWDPMGADPDLWSQRGTGGRLYVTCLSLYMLEVYYRHMPIYSEMRQKLEAAGAK
ncbi:MAG: squalene--hopene cyclase [Planctomycetes bacterium]|nr:squalene--hopene cyclase [Planctomycetota bacterium]